eukprot:gnl/MRDRNA2_/MRDRNA2_196078_c0_seq1.p1 gnl/MRDRNA2_/MRDRNA2_196078_c0~~gnl/MRDRNA2_/MRDRNA2_196078_c0_seq1.p1  ORF type:complete len:558 (+),score=76.27 gnl/MRDRNA2_/MRDRNA2_196078_c0_seq1:212-1675(+)
MAAVFSYGGISAFLGSPEGIMNVVINTLTIFVLSSMAWLGCHQTESRERHRFLEVFQARKEMVEEKVARFDLEHMIETGVSTTVSSTSTEPGQWTAARQANLQTFSQQSKSALTSEGGTTDTGQVFNIIGKLDTGKSINDGIWDEVKKIGNSEHWMLAEHDLHTTQECLGEGRFGKVLKSRMHGTPVALKVPKVGTLMDGDSLQTVATEIRIMRRVRHPNIVLFHGVIEYSGATDSLYALGIVLELVPGPNLMNFILPTKEATMVRIPGEHRKELVLGLLRALRYLHSQEPSVVHGDLKPENILVEPFSGCDGLPRAKLTDFGLSRLIHGQKAKFTSHPGTVRWAAPELLLAYFKAKGMISQHLHPHCVERDGFQSSADVYSFGRLCFYISTSTLPMEAGGMKDFIEALRETGQSTPLEWDTNSISSKLKNIVEGCVAADQVMRPALSVVQPKLEVLRDEEYLLSAVAEATSTGEQISESQIFRTNL